MFLSQFSKVFIIAEAGVNHNGSLDMAKKLVDVAVDSGADAVKFQTFKTEEVISKSAPMAEYQKKNLGIVQSQYEMVKKLELAYEDFEKLKVYCDEKGIIFLSTPFDIESARFLKDLGLKIFKIPSGEITNYPLLKEIGSYKTQVILSTGMCKLKEVEDALEVLTNSGLSKDMLVLLHCNTEYPTPYEDVNLKAMLTLKEAFKVNIGYSDHTLGVEIPLAAVALGAKVIEKHFTLDQNLEGPDHKASLNPNDLKIMVKMIRNIEKALGDGIKRPSASETKNIVVARKSIVAKKEIKKGEIFSENNLTTKRPGTGISPMMWEQVIGKKALRDFKQDELIEII